MAFTGAPIEAIKTSHVLDGANALVLSEETAIGEFPVEAVAAMRHVADAAWEHMQDLTILTAGQIEFPRDNHGGPQSLVQSERT